MINQPGRALRKHPLLTEAAVWPLVTACALTMNTPHPFFTPGLAVNLAVVAVAGGLSRRFPSLALAVAIGLAQRDGHYYGVVALVAFLAGWRTGSMRPFAWAPALAVPAVFVGGIDNGFRSLGGLTAELASSVVLPWLVGRFLLQRRELAAAGWDRARHLEHEQEMSAERARLRERARIAQDMHDSLGHDLALLALRASVLEVDPALPGPQRGQAAELRAGAAAATDRLHEIIGVLRADGAVDDEAGSGVGSGVSDGVGERIGGATDSVTGDGFTVAGARTAPAPVILSDSPTAPTRPVCETVDELVARAQASGLAVDFTRTGECRAPDTVGLAVHRVVREALTNAAKHVPGAVVRVCVAYEDDRTVVRVVNALPQPSDAQPRNRAPGSRSGLIGLRERVRLAGGGFRAGPTPDGFEVVAEFSPPCPAVPRPLREDPVS